MKRLLSLLIILTVFLSGCSIFNKKENSYTQSLKIPAGYGYFWTCTLSNDTVLRSEENKKFSENIQKDSFIDTDFTFYSLQTGEVRADFCAKTAWDETLSYNTSSIFTVDDKFEVSAETSEITVIINLNSPGYSLVMTDKSIANCNENEDGSFTLVPLKDGFTKLSFTAPTISDEEPIKRNFSCTIRDGFPLVKEELSQKDSNVFSSSEELFKETGLLMTLPKEAQSLSIKRIDEMGLIKFIWKDEEFLYVAGNFDIGAFFSGDYKLYSVKDYSIARPLGQSFLIGWKKDETSYYITTSKELKEEEIQELLEQIL